MPDSHAYPNGYRLNYYLQVFIGLMGVRIRKTDYLPA